MRLFCWLGFHRRSRGRARADDTGYVSVCRRCEIPMRKLHNGPWTVDRAARVESLAE